MSSFWGKLRLGQSSFNELRSSVARYIFIKVVTYFHVQAGLIKKKNKKLNYRIDLKSSSSFSQTFNILANGKSTKTAQYASNQLKHLLILHLPSHVCNKWLKGDGRKCTLLELSLDNPFSDWSIPPPMKPPSKYVY